MSTTTMQFGPEWMRTGKQPTTPKTSQPPPSPPAVDGSGGSGSYSSLVTVPKAVPVEHRDEAHPFRYSKEEILKIFRDGGSRGGLGLEIERWDGIVRETATEPVGLREASEAENKLFAGSLNSELRRRQSSDYISATADRPRLNHSNLSNGPASPLRERFGSLMSRRKDSTDGPSISAPRKLSFSNYQAPLSSPRDSALPSPRARVGATSGFDGILNSSDSWTSRRRASEAQAKAGHPSHLESVPDNPTEAQASDLNSNNIVESGSRDTLNGGSAHGLLSEQMQNLSVGTDPKATQAHDSLLSTLAAQPQQDPAQIDWSYLDPKGNIQGPFKGEVMQRWYEGGYFDLSLLMKRTHLDSNWATMADLQSRATSDKMFLSPFLAPPPPGLVRPVEVASHKYTPSPDLNAYNSPYQPAPIRSLRNNPIDLFGTGSNPSDSPASSFGARGFNGSPDPVTFGGRSGMMLPGDETGTRLSSYSIPNDQASFLSRRTSYGAGVDPLFGSPLGTNSLSGRAAANDLNAQNSWAAQENSPYLAGQMSTDDHNHPSMSGYRQPQSQTSYASSHTASLLNGRDRTHNAQTSFGQTGALAHDPHLLDQSYYSTQNYQSSPAPHFGLPQNIPESGHSNVLQSNLNVQSQAWDASSESSSIRRPGPFDSLHPTSHNTAPGASISGIPSHTPSQENEPAAAAKSTNDALSWYASSQGIMDDAWSHDYRGGPNSLTADNLGQHNLQHSLDAVATEPPLAEVAAEIQDPELAVPNEPSPVQAPSAPAPSKSKSKKAKVAEAKKASAPVLIPAAVDPIRVSSTSPLASTPKTPWGTDDESKKIRGGAMSLREIQEAEKKAEAERAKARKAESERERVSRNGIPPSAEESASFTASWGLPTSQAGSRSAAPNSAGDGSSGSTAKTSQAPVWSGTNGGSSARKTMKEIQEEEERRKKSAQKETVASIASKRVPTETAAAKVAVGGGAWTTVGSNGKTNAAGSRPPLASVASAISTVSPSVSRPAAVPSKSTTSVPVSKPIPAPSHKVEEAPAPSADFLRWLNDSLKGLNNAVNVEEIMSMLLTFPVDPDASTVELISDLIYANSTTMDGRRYASEFVSKRKADASATKKGAAPSKTVSIADVVKAQPKTSQPEWGGFKVVNKKKKGARA